MKKDQEKEIVDVSEILEERGQIAVTYKGTKSFELNEVEISGALVILRGWATVFGEPKEVTRVYRRVR